LKTSARENGDGSYAISGSNIFISGGDHDLTENIVYLVLAAIPGLIVVAAVYKYMEVAQAARWPSVPGRVVLSTAEGRSVSAGGADTDDTEIRNFAKIVYEYVIAGQTFRCDRVSIGEDMGNSEVAQTIARYPVGKPVTVYYNPNKRSQAVLERNAPAGLWKGIIIIVLVLAGLIVGGIVGFHKMGDLVSWTLGNSPKAPFVAACIGFGLLFSLVIIGIQRSVARQRAWPTVQGRVESSGVHQFQKREQRDNEPDRWVTYYRAEIVYSYEVAGVRYTADKSKTGGGVSSNIESIAQKAAAAYPVGRTFEIHYNPDNPADSAVDPGSKWLWLLWLVPAIVFVIAYLVAR